MSNWTDPAGEDMDAMNTLNDKLKREEELLNQSFRMVYDTGLGRLLMPTTEHVSVLVKRIQSLEEQIKLGVTYGDIKAVKPEEPY
jgi:hypothetical protein